MYVRSACDGAIRKAETRSRPYPRARPRSPPRAFLGSRLEPPRQRAASLHAAGALGRVDRYPRRMLLAALETVLAEGGGEILAVAAFDELGNLVEAPAHETDATRCFEPFLAAWRVALARSLPAVELRVEGPDVLLVGRRIGEAFVVASVHPNAPGGRTATLLRLHHEAICGALP